MHSLLLRSQPFASGVGPRAFRFVGRGAAPAPRSTIIRSARGSAALALGCASVALASGLAIRSSLQCDASTTSYRPYAAKAASPPPPTAPRAGARTEAESITSLSHLGFGTVTGVCAGIFVKKGLKLVAFFIGGAFVLLQYLHSRSLVTIDWPGFARSYEATLSRRTAAQRGETRLAKLVNGFSDFLTADFQGRATFLAGFVLGFRMG